MITKSLKTTESIKAPAAAAAKTQAASPATAMARPASMTKAAPAAKKAPVPKASPAPKAKPAAVSHEFSIAAPNAKDVFLVGEFNNWDVTALRMKKSKAGTYTKSVKLAPGRYEYLFNVDGQWMADPAASARCPNPFGGENSVLTL